MRRTLICVTILTALWGFAPAALAKQRWVRVPTVPVTQPACPSGVPVQDITVVKREPIPAYGLSRVERAAVLGSLVLHRWWNTPCVQFTRSGGWPFYLYHGPTYSTAGVHYVLPTRMLEWTGGLSWQVWSVDFSHELWETLVHAWGVAATYLRDGGMHQLEVTDPVDKVTFDLADVHLADFVTPGWYAGSGATCGNDSNGVTTCSQMIAPADAPWPYDAAHDLPAPWSTDSISRWHDGVCDNC